jgi:hypothetical protein
VFAGRTARAAPLHCATCERLGWRPTRSRTGRRAGVCTCVRQAPAPTRVRASPTPPSLGRCVLRAASWSGWIRRHHVRALESQRSTRQAVPPANVAASNREDQDGELVWSLVRAEPQIARPTAGQLVPAQTPLGERLPFVSRPEAHSAAVSVGPYNDESRSYAGSSMARARIELATPRFSVVVRCAHAGRGRRRAGKMSLQIAIIGT